MKLTVVLEPADEGGYTALCPELDVASQGESVSEATVAKWFKKPGDAVADDEPLVELEPLREALGPRVRRVGVDPVLELVDEDGVTIGTAEKLAAHQPPGQLHRAFSVFLFDGRPYLYPFIEDTADFAPLIRLVMVDLIEFHTLEVSDLMAFQTEDTVDLTLLMALVTPDLMAFQTAVTTDLMPFQTVDVTVLMPFQIIVMNWRMLLNWPVRNETIQASTELTPDLMPFQAAAVPALMAFQAPEITDLNQFHA